MMFAVHLPGQDDVEHVHHHRFFERRMIRGEVRLKCTTAGLRIAFVDDFFGHALTADMFDVIEQSFTVVEVHPSFVSNRLRGPCSLDPELNR
jgi:hypothetical protein